MAKDKCDHSLYGDTCDVNNIFHCDGCGAEIPHPDERKKAADAARDKLRSQLITN